MSEAATFQLSDRTVKTLALLAGGAGPFGFDRLLAGLMISLRSGSGIPTFVPQISLGLSFVSTGLFALWLGWLIKSRALADWASIGYLGFTLIPLLFVALQNTLAYLFQNPDGANGPIFNGNMWPFLFVIFVPPVGFQLGAHIALKRGSK
ncbi:MAG: hypothetical protein P8P99_00990 [Maricaulis sp.]|nr:hypothetical protein [Maricaulis sp.]